MEREADKDLKASVSAVPLCEILPLPESAKDTERGGVKALKTSVPSVPPCETLCLSHARSHGVHKGYGGKNRRGRVLFWAG